MEKRFLEERVASGWLLLKGGLHELLLRGEREARGCRRKGDFRATERLWCFVWRGGKGIYTVQDPI